MQDTEIRTLSLRFASRETAKRFYNLCDRYGHQPAQYTDKNWYVVTATFQNKAAKSKLVAIWARESMIISE
jgi:uncharacterized protein YjbK